jgi:NADH-quinone oxidoreductase subunit M
MGKTMFFNLNSGTVFVTTVDGVDGFSSSFYISVVFFFFTAILVSWWLFDYWVKAQKLTSANTTSSSAFLNFIVITLAFFLFFAPSIFLFVASQKIYYIPLKSEFFALFGSFDSLSILFVFMVHVVDGLTLAFLLLYYHTTTLQSRESLSLYVWSVFLMTIILDCLFLSTNFLIMFFIAEFSLFPLSFLLLKENTIFWRSNSYTEENLFENKRPLAFYYLVLFTVVSGGLGAFGLIVIYLFFGDLSFIFLSNLAISDCLNLLGFTFSSEELISLHLSVFFLLLWISVKVPLVPIHIWLPKAHVEGSTESSMLLAGIILKITTYVIIRLSNCWFFSYFFSLFESFFLTMAVTTAVFGALGALSTIDLKRLAAYSSVSHMGIIMLAGFLLTTSSFSLQPYLILLMTHTFISTTMFLTIGCIYKLRLKNVISRNRLTYSGLLFVYPYFFLIGLIFFANLNIPLTLGFAGELGVLISAVQTGFSAIFFVLVGSFLLLIPMLMIIAQVLLGPLKTFELVAFDTRIYQQNATNDQSTKALSDITYFSPLKIYSEISYSQSQLAFHNCLKFILTSVSLPVIVFGIFPFIFARLVNFSALGSDLLLSNFFLFSLFSNF